MDLVSQELARDPSLKDVGLSEKVRNLREAYFKAVPEICIERPVLVTRYSRELGLFGKDRASILDKARLYRKVLENRKPVVRHVRAHRKTGSGMRAFDPEDTSPFAGSTTGRFKGVCLYPEFLALTLWPELWTISKRKSNPYHIDPSDVETLNFDVFPHWMDGNILELARKSADADQRRQIGLMQRLVFFLASKPECISHTIPDFSRAVKEGLRGIIADAEEKKHVFPDKFEFYMAIQEAMHGIIGYAGNLAREAEVLAHRARDENTRRELLDIAAIYSHVPEFPARSFREGLTTVWVCWTAAHLENPNVGLSLGRLDQVLFDVYKQDMEAGRLDLGEAVDLLAGFWLKIGDHVPAMPDAGEQLFGGTGSNQAVTIGGVDRKGRDAVNDLTYLFLRVTELMLLRDPNLNARYYKGVNPEAYLRRCCEVNIQTGATPALHNDRAAIFALTAKGESEEDARDYGVIGCIEPGSNGRFYGHTAAILFNLPSALELAMFNGRHRHTKEAQIGPQTGDPADFGDFESFWQAFETQTRWLIDQAAALNDLFGVTHQRHYPTPILSALFEGPMDKGLDLIEGGAKINASGATIIGLADVADSLSAIRKTAFGNGAAACHTLPELIRAMERNFEGDGDEALHVLLTNEKKTPKYGNDDREADDMVRRVVTMLDEAFDQKVNYRGGRFRVGYWTMTNHAGFGRLMGAMPNGRKAGQSFASGITPVSGVTSGLIGTLQSAIGLPPDRLSSGVALNLKFTPLDGDRKAMLDNLMRFVEPYFGDDETPGGMEIQFNVIDHQKFLNAVRDPDKYSELLVRVSGYTAYFKDLNPEMQQEIIDRTEYRLSSGQAQRYPEYHVRLR